MTYLAFLVACWQAQYPGVRISALDPLSLEAKLAERVQKPVTTDKDLNFYVYRLRVPCNWYNEVPTVEWVKPFRRFMEKQTAWMDGLRYKLILSVPYDFDRVCSGGILHRPDYALDSKWGRVNFQPAYDPALDCYMVGEFTVGVR